MYIRVCAYVCEVYKRIGAMCTPDLYVISKLTTTFFVIFLLLHFSFPMTKFPIYIRHSSLSHWCCYYSTSHRQDWFCLCKMLHIHCNSCIPYKHRFNLTDTTAETINAIPTVQNVYEFYRNPRYFIKIQNSEKKY